MRVKAKNFLIVVYVLMACNSAIHAQRYHHSTDLSLSVNLLKGGQIGFEKFVSKNDAFESSFNLFYRNRTLTCKVFNPSYLDFLLTESYRRYFSFGNSNFFPFVSIGGFGGYETCINQNQTPYSLIFWRKSGWLYGIKPSVGCEYNFGVCSLQAGITPSYEFHYMEFIPSFNLGFKWYF